MKLLVGLGNPGSKHARHRHNVGFMAVDRIAERNAAGPWRKRFQGQAAELQLGDEKCLLLKPQTYMNESGRAAGDAVRFYKIGLEDVVVFHDELDLAPGKVRVKAGGGVAGHNGLRSLTSHLGNDYRRVRIGIGHPGRKDRVQPHVLGDFAKRDADWLEPLLDAIADAAPRLAEGDDANFMNEVALATAQEPEPEPAQKPKPKSKPSGARGRAKGGAPSAQDLARAQAERDAARESAPDPAEPEPVPEATGPLAQLLRKWIKKDSS